MFKSKSVAILKRQTTLWGYDPEIVTDFMNPKNSNIFIAAKPGNEELSEEELSNRSDAMLAALAALKEEHGEFGITSATGRGDWGTEPSFVLTNVPESARAAINQIAEEFGQESIGVSESGEEGASFVTPAGEVTDKFGGMEMQENPEYSTDFPSGQRLTFTDWQEINKAGNWWDSVDDPYAHEKYDGLTREEWIRRESRPGGELWEPLTDENSWQPKLHNFDPRLDRNTGWGGVEPVGAVRVIGDFPPGSSVVQGEGNVEFEHGGGMGLPKRIPKPPPESSNLWDKDVESEWEKDPKTGFRYYYDSTGQKTFVDLEPGMKGSWWARPTRKDIRNIYTHGDPTKIVFVRGNPEKYGNPMKRDSDEARENLAEMFLQHDEPIPKEELVSLPLTEHYRLMADKLGVPKHSKDYMKPSRWSDEVPPWDEKKAEPMDIAFQLLKERKSPEAWAHKRAYDSEYQKNPKRLKYRVDLNRERRRRGIYGKGGKDVSHTQGGKLTLENPHANRARHFKNRGTLRRVKVR